ncbi:MULTISPECIES: hypothetical protein [unclassified Streptosporangium]|uniref:hypothetical protein n=1 Tax=unclassified Streptosporangium TaxID=2632669 RepID=UPI002E2956F3|nr:MULTISPECIES: hypothetical protein [unclassified Streptosporangium]
MREIDISFRDFDTAVSELRRLSDTMHGHTTALQADLSATEDSWGSGEFGSEAGAMYRGLVERLLAKGHGIADGYGAVSEQVRGMSGDYRGAEHASEQAVEAIERLL